MKAFILYFLIVILANASLSIPVDDTPNKTPGTATAPVVPPSGDGAPDDLKTDNFLLWSLALLPWIYGGGYGYNGYIGGGWGPYGGPGWGNYYGGGGWGAGGPYVGGGWGRLI